MAKTHYVCQNCGYKSSKWMGRCPNCQTWNSFQEESREQRGKVELRVCPQLITEIDAGQNPRFPTGIGELDRVLGGGIVSGSLILIGGAPGIGKSTLILQAASLFSNKYGKVLYVSGEESASQIKLRAERLQARSSRLYLLAETEFDQIEALLQQEDYHLVVLDSVQTVYDPRISSAPGSVSQVKEITNRLLKLAKTKDMPIFLIGHVTKEGDLAGPRVLEHLVDAVLQFEGDRHYAYRILRAVKNRFGSTNEVGVFAMKSSGMEEVKNPSQLFLEERLEGAAGSVIVPVTEGSRTLLVEVQALVAPAVYGTPQRLTTGVDYKRVSILLAVLEKKLGFHLQNQDVNVNIAGGFKVDEPALDLGVVTAIISSARDAALAGDLAVVGEVGLAGEVRAVSQIEQRLKELKKMAYTRIILPAGNLRGLEFDPELHLMGIKQVRELIDYILG